MFRTLHGRLAAVLLGLLCLSALLYAPLTLFTTQRYLQEANQKLNRTLARRLAQHLASRHLLGRDARARAHANAEIKHLMVLNPQIEIYLLDPSGVILAYSAAPGKVRRTRVALGPLRRFLAARAAPPPLYGDDPRKPGRQKIFSAAPLPPGPPDQITGYAYIILGGEEYESAGALLRRSYIVRFSLLVGGGMLLFVFAVGAYLFRFLTRPLRRLTQMVEGFAAAPVRPAPSPFAPAADGVWQQAVRPQSEVARLDQVFGEMTARIERQVRDLEAADTHRREMVSNVSHDLRTPLASLQGYLETLAMKEGQLTPDEQRNYLAIATRHGQRLTKLVSELFDLAKLDARDVPLHVEPFSLGELVQDVAQKFQLAASNADLRLEARFAPDLPFVCADIALIERVLENLIENALRYTPAGGAVTLALDHAPGGVQVAVRDTGRGIREQDLPHIFERYYRVEDQPETPGCAGLGLAITRRILELHGSAITVQSTAGAGTTFTFVLPLCP